MEELDDILKEINGYKGKIIYVCTNYSSLLIALCLFFYSNKKQDSFIILTTHTKKLVANYCNVQKKLQEMGIKSTVIDNKNKVYRGSIYCQLKNRFTLKTVLNKLNCSYGKYLLVNFAWRQNILQFPAHIYFRHCEKAIFIAETVTRYIPYKESSLYFLFKRLYGIQTDFWLDERLSAIYAQEPEKYVEYLQGKIRPFSFDQCVTYIKAGCLDDVLRVFLNESRKKELLQLKGEKCGIIFSQCFSTDGYITDEEQMKLYERIVGYYSQYGKLILKVHPRDKLKYCFDGIYVLDSSYPSELFRLMDIKFEFAIGICTNAIRTVDASIKINLNENFLRELTYELQPIPLT